MFKLSSKPKKIISLIALGFVLLFSFQNCGEFSADHNFALNDIGKLDIDPDVPVGTKLASPVWKLSSRENLPSLRVYYSETDGVASPQGLRIEILEGKKKKVLSGVGGTIQSFRQFAPHRIKSDKFNETYNLFFFNDQRDEVLALSVKPHEVKALWVAELQTAVSADEFANLVVRKDSSGAQFLKIGSVKISRLEDSPPTIDVEGENGCLVASEHLENGSCVPNVRVCYAANGMGEQRWANNKWGACTLTLCNSGFFKSGVSCKAVPKCSASQHLENNKCVSNTRNCAIAYGSGMQTWNGATWGSCIVKSCNSNATQVGNSCVPKTSCPSGQHFENGKCVANTKNCSIPNGTGTQTWAGLGWGTCTPKTCNAGYFKNGFACSKLPTCSETEHLENNGCTSNTRSCSITHGAGQQTWDKDKKKWGSCEVVGCYPGYKKAGNGCYKPVECEDDTHQEGTTCVANERSCTIANGVGKQTWNGVAWRACQLVKCNSGYYQKNNSEQKCYAVPTNCGAGRFFNPITKGCDWLERDCYIENGLGKQAWNIQKNEWNKCIVKECVPGTYMTRNQSNDLMCAPKSACASNKYWLKGKCESNKKSCAIAHGQGEQTWAYSTTGMSWGTCKVKSCNAGYFNLSGVRCQPHYNNDR